MDDWAAGSWDMTSGRISVGGGGDSSPLAGGSHTSAMFREVVIQRTEGQIFRERVGFILLCIIGAYCTMRVLIDLKSILEPFLWALFLVMAWKPVVDTLERRLERMLASLCFWLRREAALGASENCEKGEIMHMLDEIDDDDDSLSEIDGSSIVRPLDSSSSSGTSKRHKKPELRGMCRDIDGDDYDDSAESVRVALRKKIARGLAVIVALIMTLGVLSAFGFLILESARHMRSHWDVYQKGAQGMTNDVVRVLGYFLKKMPEGMRTKYVEAATEVMNTAPNLIYALLGQFLNNVSSLLLGGLLTLLYTLFWLCSPVPMDASIDIMFRRYIMFKTLACFGYGVCTGLLLSFMSIDLASVFALTTFVFNYVPEVGPFVAMVLPCPVILLDSRLERPLLVFITAIIGQLALKFAFSNIIEVKLIESDKKLRMHPVMILLSVGIFGYLWGPTGMLLSVPMMALLKISLFSDLVPASYRDPILVLLEGDRDAPRNHGLRGSPQAGLRNSQQAMPGG
mmetsp:Transcript_41241/g.113750  ORF Transcript_41241/g.113750 Transcript_41241/m.113750 type:complete len:512 (+) Transcript_41241:180-1715(+)